MIWLDTNYDSDDLDVDLIVRVNPGGNAIASGQVALNSDGDKVQLRAENRGTTAACSQSDDGGLKLDLLTIGFRDESTGERLTATINPDGDVVIGQGETFAATMTFDDTRFESFVGQLTVNFEHRLGPGRGNGPPGRR